MRSLSNYQEGTSKIIKSGFVSFSEQKKEIVSVDPRDPKILGKNSSRHVEQESSSEQEFSNKEMHSEEQEKYVEEIQSAREEAAKSGYEEGYQIGYQEGKEVGIQDGYQVGVAEAQQESQQKLENLKNELETKYRELERTLIDELTQYKKEIEPKVALIIDRIVRKLIGIQEVNKETILFLIRNGLEEVESYGDLIIRVSSFDIDFVQANRMKIMEELSESVQVEILKDPNLKENECIIETDMGTIDSSLGTQMERLLNELRLLYESKR